MTGIVIRGEKVTREHVDVNVSLRDLAGAISYEIRKHHNIDSDAYVDSKNRLVCDDRNWRHGSIGTDILKENASDTDIKVLNFLSELSNYVYEINKKAK